MALLEIKKYPEQVLKKRAEEVKEITPEIRQLIEKMKETMVKVGGLGLAAPQVGASKRIIIVQTKLGPKEFINPKILKKSRETDFFEEGCLSLPGLYLKIRRAKFIEAEALDIDGKKIYLKNKESAEKSSPHERYGETPTNLARILQHEVDHLNGILIISRISFWRRLNLRKKIKTTSPGLVVN